MTKRDIEDKAARFRGTKEQLLNALCETATRNDGQVGVIAAAAALTIQREMQALDKKRVWDIKAVLIAEVLHRLNELGNLQFAVDIPAGTAYGAEQIPTHISEQVHNVLPWIKSFEATRGAVCVFYESDNGIPLFYILSVYAQSDVKVETE